MNFTRNDYFLHNKDWFLVTTPQPRNSAGRYSSRTDYLGVRFDYSNTSNTIQEAQEWEDIYSEIIRKRNRIFEFSDRFQAGVIGSTYEVTNADFQEAERRLDNEWGGVRQSTFADVFSRLERESLFARLYGWGLGVSAQTERSSMLSFPTGRGGEAIHEEAERDRRASNVKKFLETPVGKALSGAGWGDICSPDAAAENLGPSASFREHQARRREGARTSYLRRS